MALPSGSFAQEVSRPVRWSAIVGGGLLTALIFVADILMPLGIAGGIPYIAPVLLAMWLPDRRLIFGVAVACTILTVIGILLSPSGADPTIYLTNRLLAVAAIWTVAMLTYMRRTTESALAQSEAANRAVLGTTADGILMLDEAGRILAANPAIEKIFGVGPSAVIGQSFSELLADEYASLFRGASGDFLQGAGKEAVSHELDGLHADGTTLPIEVDFVPILGGSHPRYTATIRDITDRRALEQHLLRTSHQERKAIGHSLHEELGQSLTGVTLIGRQLARKLQDRDLVEAQEAAELAALLHEMDNQALNLYRAIAPLDAAEHFHAAVVHMMTEVAEAYSAEIDIRGDVIEVPEDAFRAAQLLEALRGVLNRLIDDTGCRKLYVMTCSSEDAARVEIHFAEPLEVDMLADLMRPAAYSAKLSDARIDVSASSVVCRWCRTSATDSKRNGSGRMSAVNAGQFAAGV
jgi:PAS domain S-box-containing protein